MEIVRSERRLSIVVGSNGGDGFVSGNDSPELPMFVDPLTPGTKIVSTALVGNAL